MPRSVCSRTSRYPVCKHQFWTTDSSCLRLVQPAYEHLLHLFVWCVQRNPFNCRLLQWFVLSREEWRNFNGLHMPLRWSKRPTLWNWRNKPEARCVGKGFSFQLWIILGVRITIDFFEESVCVRYRTFWFYTNDRFLFEKAGDKESVLFGISTNQYQPVYDNMYESSTQLDSIVSTTPFPVVYL